MSRLGGVRRTLLALAVLALGAPALPGAAPGAAASPTTGVRGGDATVIAVIDSGFTPYHWDFLASKMPQATNRDRSDDLPLDRAPHTWLPGFPSPPAFTSYTRFPLTLENRDPDVAPGALYAQDAGKWASVRSSSREAVHYYWFPDTKVIGGITFGPTEFSRNNPAGGALSSPGQIHDDTESHGTGTASVSVGNLHGTCPECLLVFIQYADQGAAEAAIDWAMRQPWIDAISNSYGFSATYAGRDRVYNGSNVALQREASQRGQTIFFSAGNGMENAFTVPNNTLLSSQEGPDWVVTVTATDPNGGAYTGTGKPADVAGIGAGYPSAYRATKIGSRGAEGFGGTSNATPTVAGIYGRALYLARRAMPGRSRMQWRGYVANGSFRCGRVRPACEMAHGLTATELRFRLLQGAVSTGKGFTDGPLGAVPPGPQAADSRYAAEGHGTYVGRLRGDDRWHAEFGRLWGPLSGNAAPPARPAGEREWFLVDSWCRQHIWGEWTGGYYRGASTPLPPDDPASPTRTSLRNSCEGLSQPPR